MFRRYIRLTLVLGIAGCGSDHGSANTAGGSGGAVSMGGSGGVPGAGAAIAAATGGDTSTSVNGGSPSAAASGGYTSTPGSGGNTSGAGAGGTPPVTVDGGSVPAGVPPPEGFHANAMNECNLHSGWPGDEYCILPPPPDKGFQLHLGPSNYQNPEAEYLLQPGEEWVHRFTSTSANDKDIKFYVRQYRMRPGAHHTIVRDT
jgi:hypothetical protein